MNATQLKNIRKQLGLTQAKLGKLLGVSSRTIQGWEYGDQKISKTVETFLNQQIKEKEAVPSHEISMDVSDKQTLTLEEMAEFCLKHPKRFVNIPSIKFLIDYNRNEAKAELLEKHIILREKNEPST